MSDTTSGRRARRSGVKRAIAAAGLAIAAGGGGCSVGDISANSFRGLFVSGEEATISDNHLENLLADFGGVYDDPTLQAYVSEVGSRLVRASGSESAEIDFAVLNSPVVTSFSLPDGTVYVTRGMIALASNEAQLASILALEVGSLLFGNVDRVYSDYVNTDIRPALVSRLVPGSRLHKAAAFFDAPYLATYASDIVRVGDEEGLELMVKAGYEPLEAAALQATLEGHFLYRSQELGLQPGADPYHFLGTHRRSARTLSNQIEALSREDAGIPLAEEEPFLRRIDRMAFGENSELGYRDGADFVSPVMGIAFQAPTGYRIFPRNDRVVGRGPGFAAFGLDIARRDIGPRPFVYLRDVWARQLKLLGLEVIDVAGYEGATGRARLETRHGPVDLRMVVIGVKPGEVVRFLFITPGELTSALAETMRRTAFSFRMLGADEGAPPLPRALRVLRVQPGNTAEGLANNMAFATDKVGAFNALNGLLPGSRLTDGQLVKVVTR